MGRQLSPDEMRAVIRAKGWSHAELAKYWEISTVYLSRLINNGQRRIHWNDAVEGLPPYKLCAQHLAMRHARAGALLQEPQPRKRGPRTGSYRRRVDEDSEEQLPQPGLSSLSTGYRYRGYIVAGSILTATQEIGEMAQEGERGIVFAVEDVGIGERYGVIFERGEWDWFLPHHIDACLAETGLGAEGFDDFVYDGDAGLKNAFDVGHFNFW
ncbi:hypothetical protein [Burkholderia sp. Tr-20390]|uniref:hypothetical protein n=1 Tax=Burkholderia sp. Tr-20390 TaxID=2703904 RepID=UPI00197F6347|nr:hypothetical protein [Burkholderia sp. Tr-20390]MBN3729349.1 hypothetical protein [Burkholderia sp. Tr-20390]